MIKLISQLILISFHLLSNVLSSPVQEPNTSYSAVSSVMKNDTMLKVLLERLGIDLKLRQLSKTFRKAFDELCSEQLLLLDPRMKSLIQDDNVQANLNPLGPFLPKGVAILILYTSHLALVYPKLKESFDKKYPVIAIPENSSQESLLDLRNQQRKIDFERFFFMFQMDSDNELPPTILFYLYNLLRVTFPENSIVTEFIKSTGFPLNKLLGYAASGRLPVSYGVEILSRFNINFEPLLLFEAINSDIPELVGAILNNSQNDLTVLMDQQSSNFNMPMHEAAIQGNIDIINSLLAHGFPANVDEYIVYQPIQFAAMSGHYDAVVRLFELNTDENINSNEGTPPIVLAAQNGYVEIVRYFLAQTSVNFTEDPVTSYRLVQAALSRYDAELGKLLIDSGKVMLIPEHIESLLKLNRTP